MAKIAHYSTLIFIWKSKKDGNFCALDLNFSTFWWWLEQIHFSFLNRLGFMVLFFQFYSNCLWPCCALPCSRHYTLLAVVHVIVFWEAAEIFTRWTKICTNFVNVVKFAKKICYPMTNLVLSFFLEPFLPRRISIWAHNLKNLTLKSNQILIRKL